MINSATRAFLASNSSLAMMGALASENASPTIPLTLEHARYALSRLNQKPGGANFGRGRATLATTIKNLSFVYEKTPQTLITFLKDEVLPAIAHYDNLSVIDPIARLYWDMKKFADEHKGATAQITDKHLEMDHPQIGRWFENCYTRGEQWSTEQVDRLLARAEEVYRAHKTSPSPESAKLCRIYNQAVKNVIHESYRRSDRGKTSNITTHYETKAQELAKGFKSIV